MLKPILIGILFISPIIFGQTSTISGTVLTEENTPISLVDVSIYGNGLEKSTYSDENGTYILENIPYGNYELEFNFNDKIEKMDIAVFSSTLTFNHTIISSGIQLNEAQIVKIKSVKSEIEKKGFAVDVIETKEASLRNIQTNDLLDQSVGVRIRQNGGLGSSVDYNLNGMSGNSVRILIDGIPISTYGSSFNLNSIPPALIERIEVYKGVIPAELADDALGGIINVVLKKGAGNFINSSLSYGSFNTWQGNLTAQYRSNSGFTVKASGFYNYSDNDYEVWGKFVRNILPNGQYEYITAKRFNDAYESIGGRLEVGFSDVKWADSFLLGFNQSHDYNEIQHGQFMSKPYKGRFTEADANVFSLNYMKNDFLTKGLDFTFSSVYSEREQIVNDTVKWNYNWDGELAIGLYGDPILTPDGAQQGAPTLNHINRKILNIRSIIHYNFNENHRLVVSNYYNSVNRDDFDEMNSIMENTFQETRDLRKTVSSLAYELKAFGSKWKGNVFGKYYEQSIERRDPVVTNENGQNVVIEEVFNNKTTTFGYGFATSYLLSPAIVILASAEKAIRMPSENEIFGSPEENITSNNHLKPERSNNLNLGLKLGPYRIKNHKISFSANGFIRDTKDKIVRANSTRLNDAVETLPFENLGHTQSIGFEASVEYSYLNKFKINGNLSKFNSLYKTKYDDNGNVLPYYNQQLPNEPFFTINGNAQYNFRNILQKGSELNVFYHVGYVDPFYTLWIQVDSFQTPSQLVQDAGLSYVFPNKKLILSFDARNIFNKQIYDNFAVQKPGRAFYVKINYTISKL